VPGTVTAEFTFVHDGQPVTMHVNGPVGEDTAISFLDSDAIEAGAPLRFLPIRWPDTPTGEGKAVVDFNYACLPPCSFSPAFMCPLPLPANRLSFPVPVGERAPIRR
jgi:uncharacterized protein (DUF1684 family)